jgi:hypothetical protein
MQTLESTNIILCAVHLIPDTTRTLTHVDLLDASKTLNMPRFVPRDKVIEHCLVATTVLTLYSVLRNLILNGERTGYSHGTLPYSFTYPFIQLVRISSPFMARARTPLVYNVHDLR